MSEQTPFSLDFVRAADPPEHSADFKQSPEDFRVEEILDFDFSGEGEHLYWLVEKRGLTTQEMLQKIAADCALPLRHISAAGIKDKQACTRQWISLHAGMKTDIDPRVVRDERITILRQERSHRKLKTGAHQGNRFRIVLRNTRADPESLESRAARIRAQGVPNYFGPQRFGMYGDNVAQAVAWFQGKSRPRGRFLQGMLISAARSWLFNTLLSRRVSDGVWNEVLEGDLLNLEGTRAWFRADSADDQAQADIAARMAILDIHPTGPLWGRGEPETGNIALDYERRLAAEYPLLCEALAARGLRQERRALRLKVKDLEVQHAADAGMVVEFSLGRGAYATSVLRELVKLN